MAFAADGPDPSSEGAPTDAPSHEAWVVHPHAAPEASRALDALRSEGLTDLEALHRLGTRVSITNLGDGPQVFVGVEASLAERDPAIPSLPPPASAPGEAPLRLDPAVEAAWLAPEGVEVEVWASFDATALPEPLDHHTFMALAAVEGRLATDDDLMDQRLAYAELRREHFAGVDADDRATLADLGLEVLASVPSARAYRVKLNDRDLDDLLALPELTAVELEDKGSPTCDPSPLGAGYCNQVYGKELDGRELADLNQNTQYYYDGGSGGFTGDPARTIAFQDTSDTAPGAHVEHFGFLDATGNPRLRNCEDLNYTTGCVEFTCMSGPPIASGCYDGHATGSIALGIGDVTHGQLAYSPLGANAYGVDDQRRRSGVARTTQGIYVEDHRSAFFPPMLAMEQVTILSSSAAFGTQGENCTGQNPASQAMNEVYEAGFPVFKSAGNAEHGDPADCRVTPPGAAHGVMAVGTYNILDDTPVTDEDQSRGGTATEGRGRSIIAFQAPNPFKLPAFPRFQWPVATSGPWYFGAFYGTYTAPKNPTLHSETSAPPPTRRAPPRSCSST